ncbi:hypothetical protein D3C85_1379090 [compost metagenome]
MKLRFQITYFHTTGRLVSPVKAIHNSAQRIYERQLQFKIEQSNKKYRQSLLQYVRRIKLASFKLRQKKKEGLFKQVKASFSSQKSRLILLKSKLKEEDNRLLDNLQW